MPKNNPVRKNIIFVTTDALFANFAKKAFPKLQFTKFITMDPEQQLTKFAIDDPVG